MGDCDICSGDKYMSFTCSECGGEFCTQHRLPEEHNCSALRTKSRDEWFKEELSVRKNRQSESTRRTEDRQRDTVNGNSDKKLSCTRCNKDTSRVCPDCGDPYCADHQNPVGHNCSSIDKEEDYCDVNDCDEDTITSCHDCGNNYCYLHYPSKKHDCGTSTKKQTTVDQATVSNANRSVSVSWVENQHAFVLLITALIFLSLLLVAL